MPEKKPEFTVTDRRKFTFEGELREEETGSSQAQEAKSEPKVSEASRPEPTAPPITQAPAGAEESAEETIAAPNAKESEEQHKEYRDQASKLDGLLGQTGERATPPMDFERLVQSIYMTAAVQMGAGTAPNEQPRVDIIGARQSIDMLGVLEEKSKGNLTEKEQQLLQSALFDLRMSFLEITNAIASSAHKPPKPTPIR